LLFSKSQRFIKKKKIDNNLLHTLIKKNKNEHTHI
jgi:hypothetical protein